ncbi:MAG: hypothetical protein Q9159_007602 [Coniocarpon cinnabarinum]
MSSRAQANHKPALNANQILQEISQAIQGANDSKPIQTTSSEDFGFQDRILELCDDAPLALLEPTRQTILKASQDGLGMYREIQGMLRDSEIKSMGGQWQEDHDKLAASFNHGQDFITSYFQTTLYGASTTPRLEAMGNAEAKAQSDPSSSTAPPIRIAAADAMQILQLEPALNEWQAAHPHDVHAMLCNASKAARRLTRKIGFDERSAELYLKMQAADEKHDAHG